MKKLISLLVATLVLTLAVGCGKADAKKSDSSSKELSVVTTIFPEYDWVKQIVGDTSEADITMLLDNGVDLHSYQPNADDIIKISDCDVFIYVGGESDEWVDDVLKEATNKDMVVINLLETLGNRIKEEEVVEGMQGEEEEEDADEEEEGPEYDEHVWLSLKNSSVLVQAIADGIAKADPDNKDAYEKNAAAYIKQLQDLDAKYEDAVANAGTKTLLFGDRFPFRYLVDDYKLDYYAAFVGCSAETEASFETITFLAGKVDELGLKNIMQIESADGRIAQTIIDNTKDKNQTVLTMDSMQSVTAQHVADGANYLAIMEKNLEILKQALQ